MKALVLLALLFLPALCFAYLDPPIQGITTYDNSLAPSLMHFTSNLGGVPQNSPSFDNPVAFYDVEVLDAVPSVDGMVSNFHPPAVLWAWGESHGSNFHKTVPGDPRCSDNTVDRNIGAPQPKQFSATFQAGANVRNVNLYAAGFTNPAPDPFSPAELAFSPYFDAGANKTLFPMLNVSVYGEIEYPVEDSWVINSWVCQVVCDPDGGCSESCGCQSHNEVDYGSIDIHASSNKSFVLEGGNVSSFLVEPVLKEQTDFAPKATLFTFSNRLLYKYYLLADGKLVNASYRNSFTVTQDSYGARHIGIDLGNVTGPSVGDPDLPAASGVVNSMEWLSNQSFEAPDTLVGWNETFAYVNVVMHNYSDGLGRRRFEFRFYDYFHDAHANVEIIATRRPVSLTVSTVRTGNVTAELLAKLTDRFGGLVSGQQILVTVDGTPLGVLVTDSGGEVKDSITLTPGTNAIDTSFAGSDSYLPASDSQSLNAYSGITLQLGAFAPLFALLAVFAAVAFESSGRIPGVGYLSGGARLLGFPPTTIRIKSRLKNDTVRFEDSSTEDARHSLKTVTGPENGGSSKEDPGEGQCAAALEPAKPIGSTGIDGSPAYADIKRRRLKKEKAEPKPKCLPGRVKRAEKTL